MGEKEGILAFQSRVSRGVLLDSFWEKRGRGYRFVHRSNVADGGRKKHTHNNEPRRSRAEGGEALWG